MDFKGPDKVQSLFETTPSYARLDLGTEVMKDVKMPKPGQKVTVQITGTVKAVEESKPEGVKGMFGNVDLDITSVKFVQASNFTELLDE